MYKNDPLIFERSLGCFSLSYALAINYIRALDASGSAKLIGKSASDSAKSHDPASNPLPPWYSTRTIGRRKPVWDQTDCNQYVRSRAWRIKDRRALKT